MYKNGENASNETGFYFVFSSSPNSVHFLYRTYINTNAYIHINVCLCKRLYEHVHMFLGPFI